MKHTYADQQTENKSQHVAKGTGPKAVAQLIDNRPATIAQRKKQTLPNSSVPSAQGVVQLVKWRATDNGFELVSALTQKEQKDGLGRPPGLKYGPNKIGKIYDTDTQEWEDAPGPAAAAAGAPKLSKAEYIGGGADDSHIHQYGGDAHLKLGKHRYNIVQGGELRDTYKEAITALEAITGERAEWAREMIAYIEEIVKRF